MSPLKVRSWDDVAAAAKVHRCRGILPNGSYCHKDHVKGTAEPGVVHWSDRTITKPGIRTFLRHAAYASDPDLMKRPRWERIWFANRYIDRVSRILMVRLPHALADLDRAMVRADLAGTPTSTPNRKEALKWSSR